MKYLLSSLLVGIAILFATGIEAQGLQLAHGNNLKTIEIGSFVQIELPKPNGSPCKKCPLNFVIGKLISVDSNQVVLHIQESNKYLTDQEKNVGYANEKYLSIDQGPIINIPKNDIMSIIVKGKNKFHQIDPFDAVGRSLISLGFFTALITSFNTEERDEAVVAVSAIAIFTGAAVSFVARQPFYLTKTESEYKKMAFMNFMDTTGRTGREVWELK